MVTLPQGDAGVRAIWRLWQQQTTNLKKTSLKIKEALTCDLSTFKGERTLIQSNFWYYSSVTFIRAVFFITASSSSSRQKPRLSQVSSWQPVLLVLWGPNCQDIPSYQIYTSTQDGTLLHQFPPAGGWRLLCSVHPSAVQKSFLRIYRTHLSQLIILN